MKIISESDNRMSQSTLGSRRGFLRSLTDFNVGQLSVSAGIRAAVLITALLIIGVLSNHIIESVVAALGTITVCAVVRKEIKQTIMIRTLILASIINASVFTIGSLIGISYPITVVCHRIIYYLIFWSLSHSPQHTYNIGCSFFCRCRCPRY